MNLIAIDPGNRKNEKNMGWAAFSVDSLIAAGVTSKDELLSSSSQLVRLSGTMRNFFVLVELPRWYPHDNSDVNDLLDLCVVVGQVKQFFLERGVPVELVWPRTWKGNVPKDVMTKRILGRLGDYELELLPRRLRAKDFDHNCVDAVGMGLWKTHRLQGMPRSVNL